MDKSIPHRVDALIKQVLSENGGLVQLKAKAGKLYVGLDPALEQRDKVLFDYWMKGHKTDPFLKDEEKQGLPDLILVSGDGEDHATINWPFKSDEDIDNLRSALFDSREMGHISSHARSVLLPDGKEFIIDAERLVKKEPRRYSEY